MNLWKIFYSLIIIFGKFQETILKQFFYNFNISKYFSHKFLIEFINLNSFIFVPKTKNKTFSKISKVSLITFFTYVYTGDDHVLTAEKAFVALTLFDIIRMPLAMLPLLIVYMVEVKYFQRSVRLNYRKWICASKQMISILLCRVPHFRLQIPMVIWFSWVFLSLPLLFISTYFFLHQKSTNWMKFFPNTWNYTNVKIYFE